MAKGVADLWIPACEGMTGRSSEFCLLSPICTTCLKAASLLQYGREKSVRAGTGGCSLRLFLFG